jgi:hypothetical protein
LTVKGAAVPVKAQAITLDVLDGHRFESDAAGIFLFAPFIAQLDLGEVVRTAGLPGTKAIPALSYLLSFLALKLLGTEPERSPHILEWFCVVPTFLGTLFGGSAVEWAWETGRTGANGASNFTRRGLENGSRVWA